jgi:hypothetical protein
VSVVRSRVGVSGDSRNEKGYQMSKIALEVNSKGETRRLDITENELEQLQSSVDGLIQPIDIGTAIVMWVNEEFLFRAEPDPNPMATSFFETVGGSYDIHGTVVFTGGSDENGNTTGLDNSTVEKLERIAEAMTSMMKQMGFVV